MTTESEAGFVRVVARADNHLVLGLQAVGSGVSELAAPCALALEMGCRLEDLAATVHAHQTMSEAIPEVAMRALGHALAVGKWRYRGNPQAPGQPGERKDTRRNPRHRSAADKTPSRYRS